MVKLVNPEQVIGERFHSVTLEIIREESRITRPRVRPADTFPKDMRVQFPRKLRELFPIGTKYLASVKVSQKRFSDGSPDGRPYLVASNISLIAESVPDSGLVAQVKAGSISGLAYVYKEEDTF